MDSIETKFLVDEIVNKIKSEKLYLKNALEIVERAKKKASELNIPVTIAIVDDGGNLICKHKMDNALLASIEIAESKAYTAIALKSSTENVAQEILPGQSLYGLQNTHLNKFCLFGGGIPIIKDNKYIGAIGVSGGTVEQDVLIAKFAIEN